MNTACSVGNRRHRITWVIKVSKFCNMRCAYCYEWDELSQREKMPLLIWRRLFEAIRDFHQIQSVRHGLAHTSIVLHGGEPLALPLAYLNDVMAIADEVLSYPSRTDLRIAVQTNLYRLPEKLLEFLRGNRIDIGVSYDFVPGVRMAVNGKETEAHVRENMKRLTQNGIAYGAITVLAKHTCGRICEVHDFFADLGIPWRVLPLFDGPESRPSALFSASHDELIDALHTLFVHWFEAGIRIPVAPLMEHFENALRKLAGIHGRLYDRRIDGEGVFVVNHDGSLFRILDGYDPEFALGNVGTNTISEILEHTQYRASLDRDDEHRELYCSKCEYNGACNGWPAFASRQSGDYEGKCPLSYRIHRFMEDYLRQHGYDESEVLRLLSSILVER